MIDSLPDTLLLLSSILARLRATRAGQPPAGDPGGQYRSNKEKSLARASLARLHYGRAWGAAPFVA